MTDQQQQISRRGFVAMTAVAAAAAGCLACGGSLCEAADSLQAASGPVEAGSLADYPKDGVYDKFAKSHKFFIIRNAGEVYATSAICSHKQAALTLQGQDIVCKKHGSKFSVHGTATKGPAKTSLLRYGISKSADGKLTVDTSKSFGEKDWEKEGASVKVA